MQAKPLLCASLSSLGRFNRHIAPMAITGILVLLHTTCTAKQLDIFGLHMGMDQAEVVAALQAKGIEMNQPDDATLVAKSLPAGPEKVKEVKCSFRDKKLLKVTVRFEVPPHEASAATLIQQYEVEKGRLGQQFGPPSKDVASMNAPTVQERYDWLRRGRGYYLAVWEKAEDNLKVTLWLYAEDAGIVLMEVYERP